MSKIERGIIIAALAGAAFIMGRYTERFILDVDGLTSSREFRRATLSGQEEKKILDENFGDLLKLDSMKGLGKWHKEKKSIH